MKAWDYLSGWTNFGLPSNIQKRLYQFLLRKAIGEFVQNDLDNFDIDLKNGHVELRKLELNLEKLNEVLSDVPLLLERGQIESIQIAFPWSNLSCGQVHLKIQGLSIDLAPARKIHSDLNMEESSILSPSLHFADDFLKTEVNSDELKQSMDDLQQSEPMEGLEVLTRMIDKILSRFKIDILDTNIRIIHDGSAAPLSSCEYQQNNTKYALELCIPKISYFDETPEFDTTVNNQMENRNLQDSSILLTPVARETIKIISIKSPTVWLVSLPTYSNHYQQDGSSSLDSHENAYLNYSLENTQFFEAEQGNSMILDSSSVDDTNTPKERNNQPHRSLILTTVDKDNWIRIKQLNSSLPIKQLDIFVTHARVTITPKQLIFLVDLLESMTAIQNTVVPPPQPGEGSNFSESSALDVPSQTQKKVKIQVSLIECLFLEHDISIKKETSSFEIDNHIRLSINNLIIRLQQMEKTSTNPLYSTLDINISKVTLEEWIVKPPEASSGDCYGTSHQKLFQTNYSTYTSIIEFNDNIKYDYSKNDGFPIYIDKQHISPGEDQVIRVRVEKRQIKLCGQYTDDSIYDEDIGVDVQAFKLMIDPQIIDRLENYIYGFKNLKKSEKKRTEQLSEQAVYEDLDRQTRKMEEKKRIRLKMGFIRVALSVPDMSQVCTRNEFNDRFHSDQLSLDIMSFDGSWDSQYSTDKTLASDMLSTATVKSKPMNISITLDYVNAFLKLHDEGETRCWFTAKTTPVVSTDDIQQPNIDIVIQDSTNIANTDASSSTIKYIFDSINNREQSQCEQHINIPIEAQAESIMGFKKYATQNSLFQVNCHFPTSQVSLSKKQWDKIQILQNDIQLWQPHFLQQSPSFDQSYESTSSNRYSSQDSSSSEKSSFYSNNLFSLSAILSHSVWYLHDTNSYRIEFTEFQFFSVLKHMGQNENITILDIDDLCLDSISAERKRIIHKSIPDKINDKRNIPMVSLVSRLTLYLESDFQHKDSSITLNQLCWKPSDSIETDFIDDIIHFQKVPEEMVFIDPVIQRTKVYVHLLDSYIDYIPDHSPSRGALVLDGVEIFTCIMPSQPSTEAVLYLESATVFLVDDSIELNKSNQSSTKMSSIGSKKYLESIGFLSVLKLENMYLNIKMNLDYPKADITLSSINIHLGTCADSFQTLINLTTYVADKKKKAEPQEQNQIPAYIVQSNPDMFASVDENSFSKASTPIVLAHKDISQFNYVEEYFKKDNDPSHHSNIPPEKPFRKHKIQNQGGIIHVLSDDIDQFQIVDDFYQADRENVEKSKSTHLKALYMVRIKNLNFWWKLYDGYDWDYLRADMASMRHTNKRQQRTNEHTQSGFGDEIAGYSDKQQYKTKHTSRDPSMEIILSSFSIDWKMLPDNNPTSMYLNVRIQDVEILDHIKTSKWNKFLGYMRSNKVPRENDACMVNLELIGLRPIPAYPEDQEHRLKVEILPIRLFIDQDALYFFIKYFTFDPHSLRSTMAINPSDTINVKNEKKKRSIFFQYVGIHQTVLKIDYKAKHVDFGKIKDGQFAELVNLVSLDGAQLELDSIKLTGLMGWDGLLDKISDEWITHIKETQLGSMVSGINPIRPVVNLSKGASDVVRLPLRQYRKDGRIIHGLSQGTQSFARATAIEFIKLSSKVTSGTQVALEHADGFFASNNHSNGSPSTSSYQDDSHFVYTDIYGVDIESDAEGYPFKKPSTSSRDLKSSTNTNHHQQFTGLNYVDQDFESTSQAIYLMTHDQSKRNQYADSINSSNRSTRSASSTIIKPLIQLTGAFQTILTGLRNSIDPATRIQNEDKYKRVNK